MWLGGVGAYQMMVLGDSIDRRETGGSSESSGHQAGRTRERMDMVHSLLEELGEGELG